MDVRLELGKFLDAVGFTPTPPQFDLLAWLVAPVGWRPVSGLRLPVVKPCSLVLAGRAGGKSTLGALAAMFRATYERGLEVVFCSPTVETTASVLMAATRRFAAPLRPLFMPHAIDFLAEGSRQSRLLWRNGSSVAFLPNRERSIRGRGPRLLVCDEVGEWPETSADGASLREFLDAVTPRQVAQHGIGGYRVLLLGTPKRPVGALHDLATAPPAGTNVVMLSTHTLRPDIKPAAFRHLPRAVYRREICCEFNDAQDAFISLDALAACERADLPPPYGAPVLAADAGFRRHASGFAVLSKDTARDVVVVHRLLRKRLGRDIPAFCRTICELNREWHCGTVLLDQFNAEALGHVLRTQYGITPREIPWTGSNRDAAFDTLAARVESERIMLPASKELRGEIASIRTRFTKTGVRHLESSTAESHGDLLAALLLGLVRLNAGCGVRLLVAPPEPSWCVRIPCGGLAS